MNKVLTHFIQSKQLPENYRVAVDQYFKPLAAKIARLRKNSPSALIVGIQGAQGTGKSTLASLLSLLLKEKHTLNVARLSLDDFYLTRAERKNLSETRHPLFSMRGVPGTHDIAFARRTLQDLRQKKAGQRVPLPRFDKALDDRSDPIFWGTVQTPVDVVILEGWCLCVPAQDESSLQRPVNTLEAKEDADGRWRRDVNACLKNDYPAIFKQIDYFIVLQAPSFEVVYDWRLLQEQKLRAKQRIQCPRIMGPSEIKRFIQFFERLTRHGFETLPEQADVLFSLSSDHHLTTDHLF